MYYGIKKFFYGTKIVHFKEISESLKLNDYSSVVVEIMKVIPHTSKQYEEGPCQLLGWRRVA